MDNNLFKFWEKKLKFGPLFAIKNLLQIILGCILS